MSTEHKYEQKRAILTVDKLIQKLQQFPGDREVWIYDINDDREDTWMGNERCVWSAPAGRHGEQVVILCAECNSVVDTPRTDTNEEDVVTDEEHAD